MPTISRALAGWRRLLWRRPWIYWCLVAALAVSAAGSVQHRGEAVERARRAWTDTQQVLVADHSAAAGTALSASVVEVPVAVVPVGALDVTLAPTPLVARRTIAAGDVLTDLDVGDAGDGMLALVPDGWLAVPIVESPRSAAVVGDHVVVATDGVALAAEAVVVGHHDDVTTIAVPADIAPLLPAAERIALLIK